LYFSPFLYAGATFAHKASGPDNISGRILKDLQNFTAPILTIIFQKSLQTGCIPTDWKHANVAPAYKVWATGFMRVDVVK
jgi:hypothetical protein